MCTCDTYVYCVLVYCTPKSQGCNIYKASAPPLKRKRSRSPHVLSPGRDWCSYEPLKGVFVGPLRIQAESTQFDTLYIPPKKERKNLKLGEPKKKQVKIDRYVAK